MRKISTTMKKILILSLLVLTTFKIVAQEGNADQRVITTAVPFVLIAADARAAGLGDIGVATSADAFSQQWNPAKYIFSNSESPNYTTQESFSNSYELADSINF